MKATPKKWLLLCSSSAAHALLELIVGRLLYSYVLSIHYDQLGECHRSTTVSSGL